MEKREVERISEGEEGKENRRGRRSEKRGGEGEVRKGAMKGEEERGKERKER